MTQTTNGFGTKFYGQRDFGHNGSYITTEWIVLALIPIFPLRSFRVRYKGVENPASVQFASCLTLSSTSNYTIGRETKPNSKQVFYVYSYMTFFLAWTIILSVLADCPLETRRNLILLCSFLVPALMPFGFRFLAKRKLSTRTQSIIETSSSLKRNRGVNQDKSQTIPKGLSQPKNTSTNNPK